MVEALLPELERTAWSHKVLHEQEEIQQFRKDQEKKMILGKDKEVYMLLSKSEYMV